MIWQYIKVYFNCNNDTCNKVRKWQFSNTLVTNLNHILPIMQKLHFRYGTNALYTMGVRLPLHLLPFLDQKCQLRNDKSKIRNAFCTTGIIYYKHNSNITTVTVHNPLSIFLLPTYTISSYSIPTVSHESFTLYVTAIPQLFTVMLSQQTFFSLNRYTK